MEGIWEWAKRNPWIAGIAVFGIGILVLWLLGYIGGGKSSSADSAAASQQQTQQNLAAAYYAAEAAQSTAGTQLQMTEANDQAAVDIYGAQDDAAVAMNSSNNVSANTIAGLYAGVGTTEANDQLTAQQAYDAMELGSVQAQTVSQTTQAGDYYNAQQAIAAGQYAATEQLGTDQAGVDNNYIGYLNNALPYEYQQQPVAQSAAPTIAGATTYNNINTDVGNYTVSQYTPPAAPAPTIENIGPYAVTFNSDGSYSYYDTLTGVEGVETPSQGSNPTAATPGYAFSPYISW